MGTWDWIRKTGEAISLPERFDARIPPPQFQIPSIEFETRPGAYVDESRIRLAPRVIPFVYRPTFESLQDAYDGIARLAWQLSGGLGRLSPRENKDRYMRAALQRFEPESTTGLQWTIEGEFLAPDGVWVAEQESAARHQIVAAAGSAFQVDVGGAHWVWPTIVFTASGAGVTDPELAHADGRSVKYTGTLDAGESLVLDPDALTAKIGSTAVLDKISLSWFDPQDRLALSPGAATLTLRAAAIGSGGSLRAEVRWRRRWL